jgi:DNA-binding transcriptional MerR regulator
VRIGELAEQSGIPARMLRYYEEQGLIEPRRLKNGYRDYDQSLVERTEKIRCFLDAGVPTRALAPLLDSLEHPPEDSDGDIRNGLGVMLRRERDRMAERIESLERSRAALTALLDTMGWHDAEEHPRAAAK